MLDNIVKQEMAHINSIQVFKPSGPSSHRNTIFEVMVELEKIKKTSRSPLLKCLNFLRTLSEQRRDPHSKVRRKQRVNFELKKGLQVIDGLKRKLI